MSAFAAFALLCLAACVTVERDAQGYLWEFTGRKGSPKIWRDVDVFLNCGFILEAKSCAVIRDDVCDIYLPPDPEPWQEAHELRHCAGWQHPNRILEE